MVEIGAPPRQNGARFVEGIGDDTADAQIDLAQCGFRRHGPVECLPRKEPLRRGLIGALSDGRRHAVERHHFGGDAGGALEIVGRAGRNVAFEEENFGGAPAGHVLERNLCVGFDIDFRARFADRHEPAEPLLDRGDFFAGHELLELAIGNRIGLPGNVPVLV
jgi:hypothetical protein